MSHQRNFENWLECSASLMTFLCHAMLVRLGCLFVRLDVPALGTLTGVSAVCWRSCIPVLSLLMFAEFLAGPGTAVCDLVSWVLTNHWSETPVFDVLFIRETFREIPVPILVLWKLPSVTNPSNRNVMFQWLEHRIFPCLQVLVGLLTSSRCLRCQHHQSRIL